jgi:hypothetical protein
LRDLLSKGYLPQQGAGADSQQGAASQQVGSQQDFLAKSLAKGWGFLQQESQASQQTSASQQEGAASQQLVSQQLSHLLHLVKSFSSNPRL